MDLTQTETGFNFSAKDREAADLVNVLMSVICAANQSTPATFNPDNHHGSRTTGKVNDMSMHDLEVGTITGDGTGVSFGTVHKHWSGKYRVELYGTPDYIGKIVELVRNTVNKNTTHI